MGVPSSIPSLPGEGARLEALRGYRILDTPPEAAFDRITSLAGRLFQVPVATIAFLDRGRLWCKSTFGKPLPDVSRDLSFCVQTFLSDSVLVVPDAKKDGRFLHSPLVKGEPGIRFCAAASLRTAWGINLGTLSIYDVKPRKVLRPDEQAILADLAASVVDELERRLFTLQGGFAPRRVDQELRDRVRQQAVVSQLGQRALAGLDLGNLLEEAVQMVAQTLRVEYCKLLELLPNGVDFLLRAGVGWDPGLVGHAIIGGRTGSQAGYSLLSSEPVIVEDLPSDRRFDGTGILHEHGIRSGVSVIIYGPKRPFGVLGAHTRRTRSFSADDIHFLQSVANILGAAVERKQSEEALKQANENLHTVVHTAPLPIIAIDLEGCVRSWNPAAERIFGWSEREVLSRPVPTIPEEEREYFLSMLNSFRSGESIVGVERRRVRKDGVVIDVMIWTAPLYDEQGRIDGTLGVFVDITERKRFEESLRQSHTLDAVCQIVEAQSPGLICSILLLDESGMRLKHGAAPSLPQTYFDSLQNLMIGPATGSCGTAVWRREAVITAEIETDPLWDGYRKAALQHGIRACWSKPIVSTQGHVLGSFAMYASEPRQPTPHELHIMERAAYLAAAVIERTGVAQALRDSEDRYRRLFEENPLPMWVFELDTLSFFAVNEAAVTHYGYSRDEFSNMTLRDILAPTDVVRLFELIEKAKVRLELDGSWQHRKKDGTIIDVETTAFTLTFAGTQVALIQANDVTSRKHAEQALRDSEEKYRTLFEESRDAIVLTSSDGKIVDANQAALDLFDFAKEETSHFSQHHVYVNSRDRDMFQQELIESGSVRDFEARLRKKDGREMDCVITATVRLSKAGAPVGYQAIIRDITARKEAERSLLELSGRLLQLQDDERRRLARELHDSTAQTLAALATNVSLVEMELPSLEDRPKKLLSDARALAVQCSRELRTISHLLHPPLLDEMGLATALRAYADGLANRSGIQVELDVAEGLQRLPRELETALFRIVQESLTNIHRHSGSPTAKITLRANRDSVTVEVQDHGRGIPKGVSEDGQWVRTLGVGIPGMRERVRQLGGKLDIQSSESGTAVRAVLPLSRPSSRVPAGMSS